MAALVRKSGSTPNLPARSPRRDEKGGKQGDTGLRGQALGNFPQAFSHLGLISAAFNVDRALDGAFAPYPTRSVQTDLPGALGATPASSPGPTGAR